MTSKSKRLLVARCQRLIRWEFWPVWAVYPPVIVSWLWHAFRLRGTTLWAGCNPAMKASGMAMEEKGGILDSFRGNECRIRIADYLRIPAGSPEAFSRLQSFMAQRDLSYPIVLKPDFGQRGQGVEIVKNPAEARRWISNCRDSIIVQQFIPGLEFGVQWSRFPKAPRGMITSLCGKHPQAVVGDGHRSLEDLILADDRAVLMARYYFKKYRDELSKVLDKGEEFTLAPIGTHSRGAVFTDERPFITEALTEAFDELGDRFSGFNFGRYDVKAASLKDLQAGRGIVVLELNGVMGEPAHIYQPGYPWRRGMADLCRHYRLAAEIGAAWREEGVAPPEPGDLLDLIRQHREKNYLEIDDFRRTT